MTYELPFDDAYEPYHASSPTDRVILELQMYGHRPHQDEPDPRPLPDDEVIRAGLAGIVETFAGMLGDTRLEPDLDDLLWSFVNVFHRAAERIARDLDRNEDAQRSSQRAFTRASGWKTMRAIGSSDPASSRTGRSGFLCRAASTSG